MMFVHEDSQMDYPAMPLPPMGRMMAFIDGENLVARFQAMRDSGRTPTNEVMHRPDVYAWSLGTIDPWLNVVQRATYYTYTTGDPDQVQAVGLELQALKFAQHQRPGPPVFLQLGNNLYPRVFSKQKSRSGKGVDIQMTVDILCNTYQNNLDVVYLVTGDGDFEPLIAECQRQGKQVVVAALSSGLSPKLRLVADRFFDLDNYYFAA